MRALLLEHEDAPFRTVTVDRPVPKAGQVLVGIRASSVNPLDLKIRSGHAAHAKQPLPAILGMELAGVVEQVGPGVNEFQTGDAVYGLTGGVAGLQGSLAEFAAVDAALLATRLETTPDKDGSKPDRLTGRIFQVNCHGKEKVRRIKEAYSLEEYQEIYTYGDSSGDRPMLKLGTASFYKPFR